MLHKRFLTERSKVSLQSRVQPVEADQIGEEILDNEAFVCSLKRTSEVRSRDVVRSTEGNNLQ